MAESYSRTIENTNNVYNIQKGWKGGDRKTPMTYQRIKAEVNKLYTPSGNLVDMHLANYLDATHGRSGLPTLEQVYSTNQRNLIQNRAIEKMDEALDSSRSFFEDWYERQQAINMAITAVEKIADFALNWRKPRYWKAMSERGIKPRDLPEAWLAYNFGLKPLIGTFDDAMHTLGRKFPEYNARGVSGGTYNIHFDNAYVKVYSVINLIWLHGCKVYGYNPNTALLSITGLNRPFSSAMSVVPWGWAVEYFFNASQLMSNFENKHPGLLVRGYWNTEVIRANFHGYRHGQYISSTKRGDVPRYGTSVFVRRQVNVPQYKPTLQFPLLLGSSKLANLTSALALSMKKK